MFGDFLEGMLMFLNEMTLSVGDKMNIDVENSGMISLLKLVWKWLGTTAMGLSLIYFLTELNQKVGFEGRDVNMKSLFAPFAKLCLSMVLFSKTEELSILVIKTYNSALTAIKFNGNVTAGNLSDCLTWFTEGAEVLGFLIMIFMVLIMVVAVIIQFVINFLWDLKIFSFKIEFMWKLSTAPFNFADVYSDKNSQAFRFLKSMFAMILTGMAIVTLPTLAQYVVGDTMVDMLSKLEEGNPDASMVDGIKYLLTLLRAIIEVALLPSFLALNCVSVVKSAIREGLN